MYHVYIMASKTGTLYVGFTVNLAKRVWEHKNDLIEGFTKKYQCHNLVYFETGEDYDSVLAREKQIKKWRRNKKEAIIKNFNPSWKDLYVSIS
ncbi:MAG: GIY-YIG nuclease family protein [Candidatus Doudnabacteria bacterium]|nr:GIY-YIG nuclease family protein [Candidatus Doudnabacteria bacterium]